MMAFLLKNLFTNSNRFCDCGSWFVKTNYVCQVTLPNFNPSCRFVARSLFLQPLYQIINSGFIKADKSDKSNKSKIYQSEN
jgi:hypothetical protein